MTTAEKQAYETSNVAASLIHEAKQELGRGWEHVSKTIRRALVHQRILANAISRPTAGADDVAYARELVRAADVIMESQQ